jgi:hypothetical protein
MAHAGAKSGITPVSSSTDGGFVGSVAGNTLGTAGCVGTGNGEKVFDATGVSAEVKTAADEAKETADEEDVMNRAKLRGEKVEIGVEP